MFSELPPPDRIHLSQEEISVRNHHFGVVLNSVVLVYVCLHKFLIPFFLNFSRSQTQLQGLDWWWIYHIALALLIKRKRWDDLALRSVLFFGLGGVLVQFYEALQSYSWNSFSLCLTAASTFMVIAYFFKLSQLKLIKTISWFSALGSLITGVAFMLLISFYQKKQYNLSPITLSTTSLSSKKTLTDGSVCGLKEFSIPIHSGKVQIPPHELAKQIEINPCGFSASFVTFSQENSFTVTNHTDDFLNVRANYLNQNRWTPLFNHPLRKEESFQIFPQTLQRYPLLMLTSDSHLNTGIVVLVNDHGINQDDLLVPMDSNELKKNLIIDRFQIMTQ